MSREYPEWDEQSKQFYRWEWMGNQRIKAYQPDCIFCGKPERKEPPQAVEVRYCPIRAHRPKCNPNCAIYQGTGCSVAMEPAEIDTSGKSCMFDSYTCNSSCAMYNVGCGMIAYFERRIKE